MTTLLRLLYRPECREPSVVTVLPGAFRIEDIDRLVDGFATEVPGLTRIYHGGGGAVRCRAWVEAEADGLDLPENGAVMEAWRRVGAAPVEPLRGPVVVIIGDDDALDALDGFEAE